MRLLKYFAFVLCIVLIIFSDELQAQDQTSLVTDRPDITESAIVIPINTFQIETGFKYQKQKIEENGIQFEYDNIILASTIFRYGINDKIEIRFGGEYLKSKTKTDLTESTVEGLQGLFVGSKLQLLSNQNIISDLALLFEAHLPFGNEKLRPNKLEPALKIAAAKDIAEYLDIGVNIGVEYDSNYEKNHLVYSTSFGFELSDRFGTFIEYFGKSMDGMAPTHNLDFGITYLQKKDIQIDASAGTLIFDTNTNWFGSIGFSMRLGRNF
jgi:hypothetical protein